MSTEPVARIWLTQGRAFLAYASKRFVDDRCPGIDATLSYTSLLALVPLAAIASVYTDDQGANFGALFCTFFVNGESNRASCYFKDIDGNVPDRFDLISNVKAP